MLTRWLNFSTVSRNSATNKRKIWTKTWKRTATLILTYYFPSSPIECVRVEYNSMKIRFLIIHRITTQNCISDVFFCCEKCVRKLAHFFFHSRYRYRAHNSSRESNKITRVLIWSFKAVVRYWLGKVHSVYNYWSY